MLILFHLNAFTGRNLFRFSLITHWLVKICPAFRIQSVICTNHSIRDKETRTRTKWLLWERDRPNFGCWLRRQWIHPWGIYSQTAVGWGDILFLPTGWNLKTFFSLSLFSLNPDWWVKIWQSFRILSVHWTYQIGLSIQDKETRTNYCSEQGKDSLWLLAGNTLNYFLKDWFSSCYWLGTYSIPSSWME